MSEKKKKAPAATGADHIAKLRGLYGHPEATQSAPARKGWASNPSAPKDWRDRLPSAADYYQAHLKRLTRPSPDGWAQACCPFHEDRAASLSVNLSSEKGGWKCFAGCGSGDLISFHMKLKGLTFVQARAELVGGRR